MALKFPSQNKMNYVSGSAISNDGWTAYGNLNLCRDLSVLNRRSYAMTDNKGVPWVFRCRVSTYPQDEDGFGLNAAVGSDFATTLKIDGCQNNWVFKNAAVKWHAALQSMRKEAGIKRSDLGAYAHQIRYALDNVSDTWLMPIDGDGDAFTGGDWDYTHFTSYADQDFGLTLTGTATEEETQAALPGHQNMAYSYLLSRAQPLADSNEHISETPGDYSILRTMLSGSAFEDMSTRVHDAREDAETQGDSPPYELIDIDDSGDINHDITESVELGRCVTGIANGMGQVIVDIPFGLCELRATHYDAADTAITTDFMTCVEVLDIYPMQG